MARPTVATPPTAQMGETGPCRSSPERPCLMIGTIDAAD